MKRVVTTLALLTTLANAESFSFTQQIRVSESHPQYERTSERIPYQECYDKRVRVQRAYGGGGTNTMNQDQVAASVLGGAVGGVLGHQIGKGKGKDVATIGGAILGTIVGGNMAQQHAQQQRIYQEPTYQTKRECVTKYRQSRAQSRLVGYENIAYYKGRRIVKISDRPLRTIPVTVTVSY